ncbi:MAG: hypothetical protein HY900_17710 [Deltaproteobacteria bacterium]|nr:hypothetical protein [Deltaproteobacteria bacterium]
MGHEMKKGLWLGYLYSAATAALGAGAALGGGYLLSRVRHKQETEESLHRLESLVEALQRTEKKESPSGH